MDIQIPETKDIRGKTLKVGDLVAYKAHLGLATGLITKIYKNKAGKECVVIGRDSYDNVKIANKTVVKIYDKKCEEEIYHTFETKYAIQDAKKHAEDFFEDGPIPFAEEDYIKLAKIYLEKHDCNISDNDQWQNIIHEYFMEERE